MEITIEGPVFFAQEDENRFFEWIYSLRAYDKVVGEGTDLRISLREPVDDESVRQLLVLCRRWCIDIQPLRQLRRPSNERLVLWEKNIIQASNR